MSRARRSAAMAIALLIPILLAHAANPDLVVTKPEDTFDGQCDSDCSLREAIQAANEMEGSTRIIVPPANYHLSLLPERDERGLLIEEDDNSKGDLDVHGVVTFVGNPWIIGDHIDRVLHFHSGAQVSMQGVLITDGEHTNHGGGMAIDAGATVYLRNCQVANNIAGGMDDGGGYGGGIANRGSLVVESSLIYANRVDAGIQGGLAGRGGGLFSVGPLTIRESEFIDNRAARRDGERGYGGAVYNGGNAQILRSTFHENGVGRNGAGTTILNAGGAAVRMENSTIAQGDSLSFFPIGAVANGQSSDTVPAVMRLINVSIVENGTHGLLNYGRLEVSNSLIVANHNSTDEDPPELNCLNIGPLATFRQRGLLRSTDAFTNCEADIVVSNASVFQSVLGFLEGNSWRIPTYALLQNSPAVDAAVGPCPTTDQRRVRRPKDGNGDGVAACDIGAYERVGP